MVICDQDSLRHRRALDPRIREALLRLALMVFILIMTLPLAPGLAAGRDPLALTGPADADALSSHLEYIADPDWQLKVEDFAGESPVETTPVPGPIPDFGYTKSKIWLRLDMVNRTSDARLWRFFVHANFTQQIAIYRIGADAAVTTLLNLTEDTPFNARPIDSPQIVAPFDLAPSEAATLIVAYYSQGASRLSMSVETPESFVAQMRVSEAKSYAFYGMMLVMITLAIVALVVLRQWVFAAYAAYLISALMYVSHADGAAFQYIWPNFPRFNSMASVVAGSGVMVFGALFAIMFLQTARYHAVMHRVLQALIVCVLSIDVILWSAEPQLLKRLLVVMISLSALCCLTAGLVAARTRFREVRFYVFAWIAGLIPAILFTGRYGFGYEPTIISTYDAVRLALVVDALMMGLAVFDRYNHLRRSAMEETLVHAQRNLALSQRLSSLEESYQQVTENARQREESVKDTVHDLRQPMHALRLSLRQMFSTEAGKTADAGQLESALGYMERLVAERLADQPQNIKVAASAPSGISHRTGNGDTNQPGNESDEPRLHGVLRGIAEMFASEAADKGLELRLVLAAPDANVAAYPLMRVIANLVSNAIKYTAEGRVVVALRKHGPGHRIEVHDTGPGLNGMAFEQALKRNSRLERDQGVADGSGLGLSVVKEIVEANNWRLGSCAGRRTGASILIELPCAGSEPLSADLREH